MDTFLYFAFGSNMSLRRLAARTPSAALVGVGEVQGYTLVFDKISKDGSGKADCLATGSGNDVVYGGVYEISSAEALQLDKAEGAGQGYARTSIDVQLLGHTVPAVTYLATRKQDGLLPYDWYLQHVLVGARELGLPEAYVAALELVSCRLDVDAARVAKELAIYSA